MILGAAKVRRGVRRFRPFCRVIEPPILAVDVKVIVIAALARLPHVDLRVARKLISNEHTARIASETPRVVLEGAQIVAVERVRSILAREHRILQFRRAILLPKEKAERMLGIAGAPAVTAANPQAAVDLKTFCPVRINQFDGRGPFPGYAVPARVCVNAVRRVKQIRQVGDDGIRGDRLEIVDDRYAVGRGVYHVRVHAVVHDVCAPTSGPAWWRRTVWRLENHVVQENVRLRVHVRRLEAAFERGGANHRGAADRQRAGVGEPVGQRWHGTVGRVFNRGIGGGCCD